MGEYKDFNDVAIAMTGIKKDVKSLEHRMELQEKFNEDMRELVTSVKLLAQNMEQMLKKQESQEKQLENQGNEIQEIKMQPAKNWTNMTKTIFTTIVGTIAGAMVAVILNLI